MISIFNGKSRGIGRGEKQEVFVQVSVALRAHLHLLKGAPLGVFLAIALHCDENGWAFPSVRTLRIETGYNPHTIADALTRLCALTIDDQRVLLCVQDRQTGGTFAQNRYLIFPSADEVRHYADATALRKPRNAAQPHLHDQPSDEKVRSVGGAPSVENVHAAPCVENLHTAKIEEIAIQGSRTPQTDDSPSVGKPHAVYMYGRRTKLKKNQEEPSSPTAQQHAEKQLDDDDGFFLQLRRRKIGTAKARQIAAMGFDAPRLLAAIDRRNDVRDPHAIGRIINDIIDGVLTDAPPVVSAPSAAPPLPPPVPSARLSREEMQTLNARYGPFKKDHANGA